MDTESSTPIIKGPSLKDLSDSLARKSIYMQGPFEMYLVQCVSFDIGRWECWYVLINALKRPNLEDRPWVFEGRIVKQGTKLNTYWKPCYGEYSVTTRTGWIKEGTPES